MKELFAQHTAGGDSPNEAAAKALQQAQAEQLAAAQQARKERSGGGSPKPIICLRFAGAFADHGILKRHIRRRPPNKFIVASPLPPTPGKVFRKLPGGRWRDMVSEVFRRLLEELPEIPGRAFRRSGGGQGGILNQIT